MLGVLITVVHLTKEIFSKLLNRRLRKIHALKPMEQQLGSSLLG